MSLVLQPAVRPSEGLTHWYTREGAPMYEVPRSDGKGTRPTTLRDARKLDLVPSVTTIIKSAASHGLENWKLEQMLMSALTLPRKEGEPEAEWIDRVRTDSRETGRKAADRGNKIHAAIQNHYEANPPEPEDWPYVQAAKSKLDEAFGPLPWTPEASFASALGYGGKVDLHCEFVVVDVKTKEFDHDKDPADLVYDEHAMQLAAYARGLRIHAPTCANLFVSVTNPGLAKIHIWSNADVRRGLRMFDSLLAFWQAKNKMDTEQI